MFVKPYPSRKPGTLVPLVPALLLAIAMQASADTAVQESAPADSAPTADESNLDQADSYPNAFPAWPTRRPAASNTSRIPPAPPGPYMSTALTGDSMRGMSFGRNPDDDTPPGFNPPMNTFSPDRPWPKMRMTDRWMPEGGYNFIDDAARKAVDQSGMSNTARSMSREMTRGQYPRGQYPQGEYPGAQYPVPYPQPYRQGMHRFGPQGQSFNTPSMSWSGPGGWPGSDSGSRYSMPSMNMNSSPSRYYAPTAPRPGSQPAAQSAPSSGAY